MTVFLPIRPEAQITARLSVALLGGEQPALDQLVADAGVDAQVTETPEYERGCQRAGLGS